MALLEVRGLRAGYGRAETIRSVDLAVPSAATVVLLGPNGAGKTTLLKTIAGLVDATGGEVRFQGRALTRAAPHVRARRGICLIPEGRGIFRRLSVRENLVVQADGGAARAAVERAAALFAVLGRRLDQPAGTLSGGEQQMLALARAFVTDAPLILADELSMGLAPVVVDQIFAAVGVLRNEGRSVLLVEQYVERAVAVADYVYILNKGRVVFTGLPAECSSSAVFARYLQGAA
ncbi:MAG TPA: ABC transporter ATP-binding protein [Acidimicrobiia bacterium]|nr:ABC transporter ATP-binding protein [Acidimicrobiia bacterium]